MKNWTAIALGALLLSACDGQISAGDGPGTGDEETGDSALRPEMRRLTHEEYQSTLSDLFPAASFDVRAIAASLPRERNFDGFANGARELAISPLHFERYFAAAEQVATNVTADVPQLMGCDLATEGAPCLESFIETLGKRAYRRPLAGAEVSALTSAYQQGVETADTKTGLQLVVTSLLVSPHFLFRMEFGDSNELDDYQIASRMSYLLIGTLPDDELFAAADQGLLSDPDIRKSEAARLIEMYPQKNRTAVLRFYEQWLSLNAIGDVAKDRGIYTFWDNGIRGNMAAEMDSFLEEVLWADDGRLPTLLLAPYTIMPPGLWQVYGVEEPAETVKLDLNPEQRGGLLTLPGVMAILSGSDQSSPTRRGAFIRERFLCETLPPIPDGVSQEVPGPDEVTTTRERFDAHQRDPGCSGCHDLIDPIGYGFENFDAVGRYRIEDNGQPVDSSGDVIEGNDAEGPFRGSQELAARLAQSTAVHSCVTRNMFEYFFGRPPDSGDGEILADASEAFAGSDYVLEEIILAFIYSDAFIRRQAQ